MEEPKVILIPEQDGKFRNPQWGRIYNPAGIAPCIDNMGGGNREPKIMQIGSYSNSACNAKILDANGICPTLLNHKGAEPAILTPVRSEKAKELRRQGIETYSNRELVPRVDNVSNTITTVQKDNLLSEPCILSYTRDDKGHVTSRHEKEIAGTLHTSTGSGGNTDQFVKESATRQDNIAYKQMPNGNIRAFDASTSDKRGISELQIINPDNERPTITTAHEPKVLLRYRIRKLTPRECFRLMNVDDSDIDKIEALRIKVSLKNGTVKEKPLPKSAKYKLAGNSIVVSCLYHIFHKMFIAEPPEPKPIQPSLFDL